jgi:hypothetical protein
MPETTDQPDDSVSDQPSGEETPQPPMPPVPEALSEEEGSEEASDEDVEPEKPEFDPYSVQQVGTDPTKSAQEGDESGLSMDELVDQIFKGKWGNGQERRNRLAAAGYNHVEVNDALVARMNEGRDK